MGAAARILIVDDEPHARSALSELLRDEGYEVDAADDGVAARDRLPGFRPDLVLSDVEMPRMGGLELAEAVRATPDAPALVLMSSRELPRGRVDAPLLRKPIELPDLLATLERSLAGRRRR